ncbi:hypothetical protein [Spirillospora sp. CA-294931]|uniref:hypothetical protein n=1 Tax=Spirillospora sp. CA-294931 TaxID=3240042 RepID=UPI003D93EE07
MNRNKVVVGSVTAAAVALTSGLVAAPAHADGWKPGIEIQESKSRVKAVGPGFTLRMTKHGIRTTVDEDEFGDPSTGNPIQRTSIDMAGRTLRPFECDNGTYTIKSGKFDRTLRVSTTEKRPLPYSPEFAVAFPGVLSPFLGVIDGTVTNAQGETLRVLVSDLAHEELTKDSFTSTSPIHGYFVDSSGKIRDRISLIGRFKSGRNGENARHWIEDRGTCRQIVDLAWGPLSKQSVATGPLFVLPFKSPLIVPDKTP